MPLLFGHDQAVAEWVQQRMEGVFVLPHVALGMLDQDGTLRGGFVLTVHNPTTAELTLYSEDVVTNGMFGGFFRWCFLTLGVYRLQIRTERTNAKVKRAAPKFGFKFEGVAKDYYGPGHDALLFYMTPHSCRWIKTNGKLVQNSEGAGASERQPERGPNRKTEHQKRHHGVAIQQAQAG